MVLSYLHLIHVSIGMHLCAIWNRRHTNVRYDMIFSASWIVETLQYWCCSFFRRHSTLSTTLLRRLEMSYEIRWCFPNWFASDIHTAASSSFAELHILPVFRAVCSATGNGRSCSTRRIYSSLFWVEIYMLMTLRHTVSVRWIEPQPLRNEYPSTLTMWPRGCKRTVCLCSLSEFSCSSLVSVVDVDHNNVDCSRWQESYIIRVLSTYMWGDRQTVAQLREIMVYGNAM